MLNLKYTKPKEFSELSRQVYEKLVPKDHIFVKINEKVDLSFVNELCANLYCQDNGRPAYSPEIIFRGAIVQFYYDLSDRKTEEEITFNIIAKWFIGLEVDAQSFDHSTICKFRARLGEEKFDEIFNRILKQIMDAGLLTEEERQIADATHVISSIVIPTIVELVKQANTKVVKSLEMIDKEFIKDLDLTTLTLSERYEKSNREKRALLIKVVKESQKLIKLVNNLLECDKIKDDYLRKELQENVGVLMRILRENVKELPIETESNNKKEDSNQELKTSSQIEEEHPNIELEKKAKDRIVSLVDKNARLGHKSSTVPFCGYKAYITMTENRIITGVRGEPGNISDDKTLVPMIDKQQNNLDLKPSKVCADSQFGTYKNRHELIGRGIQLVSPFQVNKNKSHNVFGTENFIFDKKNMSVTCPAGITTYSYWHENGRESIRFLFPQRICNQCQLKTQCKSGRKGRMVWISYYYETVEEARRYNQTQEYLEDAKTRARIEPKFSEMKNLHGLRKAKYRGLKKFNIQLLITAIVVNIKRFVNLLYKKSA